MTVVSNCAEDSAASFDIGLVSALVDTFLFRVYGLFIAVVLEPMAACHEERDDSGWALFTHAVKPGSADTTLVLPSLAPTAPNPGTPIALATWLSPKLADLGTVQMQPMHVAQLQRRIVVDASHSSDPDLVVSDSSCSSSSDTNDSRSCTNSVGSTSTATPTTTSSSSSKSPVPDEPPAKKFRRRGIPTKPTVKAECIDIDDAS